MSDKWFTEYHSEGIGLTVKIKEHLYSKKSVYQQIDVYDTYSLGRLLTLDGLVMVSDKDEFVYHETLVHPAMLSAENIKNILVIGGGDGGTVREILKYNRTDTIEMVEIDSDVIDVSRKFFPEISSGLDNKKVEIINKDIMEFFKTTKKKYDLIFVDTSDPVGPAEKLYSDDFYKGIYNHLNSNGIASLQFESPWWHEKVIKREFGKVKKYFSNIEKITAPTLTYPGGYWLFLLVSKDNKKIVTDKRELPLNLKFINEKLVKNIFAVPEFVESILD